MKRAGIVASPISDRTHAVDQQRTLFTVLRIVDGGVGKVRCNQLTPDTVLQACDAEHAILRASCRQPQSQMDEVKLLHLSRIPLATEANES